MTESGPRSTGGRWRPVVLVAAIVAVLVSAKLFGLGERLVFLREWIEGLGAWGPVAFLALYVVAVVAAIPGSAITVAAGALFGSVLGTILVSIGSTVGAGLSFLIGRYFARGAVEGWLGANERFRKLDRMTERHGAVMVALARLVPLFPFNLVNYGFGLTRVPFWTYLFWSWLCMLPGTVVYVVGADALTRAIADGTVPWMLLGALVVVIAALLMLVRFARARLDEGAA